MQQTRKKHSPAFKAKVALDALIALGVWGAPGFLARNWCDGTRPSTGRFSSRDSRSETPANASSSTRRLWRRSGRWVI